MYVHTQKFKIGAFSVFVPFVFCKSCEKHDFSMAQIASIFIMHVYEKTGNHRFGTELFPCTECFDPCRALFVFVIHEGTLIKSTDCPLAVVTAPFVKSLGENTSALESRNQWQNHLLKEIKVIDFKRRHGEDWEA